LSLMIRPRAHAPHPFADRERKGRKRGFPGRRSAYCLITIETVGGGRGKKKSDCLPRRKGTWWPAFVAASPDTCRKERSRVRVDSFVCILLLPGKEGGEKKSRAAKVLPRNPLEKGFLREKRGGKGREGRTPGINFVHGL